VGCWRLDLIDIDLSKEKIFGEFEEFLKKGEILLSYLIVIIG